MCKILLQKMTAKIKNDSTKRTPRILIGGMLSISVLENMNEVPLAPKTAASKMLACKTLFFCSDIFSMFKKSRLGGDGFEKKQIY